MIQKNIRLWMFQINKLEMYKQYHNHKLTQYLNKIWKTII